VVTTMARGIVAIELALQKWYLGRGKCYKGASSLDICTGASSPRQSLWIPVAKILPSAMTLPTMPQTGKFSTFSLAVYVPHPDVSDGSSLGGRSPSDMKPHHLL
jgi:hypothetical protein